MSKGINEPPEPNFIHNSLRQTGNKGVRQRREEAAAKTGKKGSSREN
jgi:hypothetical protein